MFLWRSRTKPYITVLDIGTFKICGLMVHIPADGIPEIVGSGCVEAKGIKAGAVVNLEEATDCIQSVLAQIERQAGHEIESVTVNISATHLKSHHLSKEIQIPDGHAITDMDVNHLVDSIRDSVPPDEEVIHTIPLSYSVDKEQGIVDPRGQFGDVLKAYVHVVTVPGNQLKNLLAVFDRCHVEIDTKVAAPYAAALAILTEEEKDIGVTALDMGAGTTSFAVFMNGVLMYLGLVPQGGNQITRDVAQVLSCSIETAERLKTLNGSAFSSSKDSLDRLIVPMIGEESETNSHVPRSELFKIIIQRVEEILDQVGIQLAKRESFIVASRRIVLCGGASSLQGMKAKVESVLNANVRIGKADVIKNLPNQVESYTFITCIGLLKYVMARSRRQLSARFSKEWEQQSRWGKVLKWLMK